MGKTKGICNLPITSRLRCHCATRALLSSSVVSIAKVAIGVNKDLMQDFVESYNGNGGFENDKSVPKELYMQDKLQTSVSALRQLSPPSQEIVVNLIRQLAENENIVVPLTPSTGLQTPAEGMELWEAHLTAQNWSRNTIKTYKTLLTTYLRDDPTPTTLSIKL